MEEEYNTESDDSGDSIELVTTRTYVSEAKTLIYTKDEITIQNALIFNKALQTDLMALKNKLENMKLMCVEKYRENEKLIAELSERPSSKTQHRNSFYFCGYPYFKSRDGYSAPCPEEYFVRKNTELFPLTLNMRNTFWLPKDKMLLIQGVREQLIHFIQTKNRDKVRKFNTRTKAAKTERITKENTDLPNKKLTELLAMIDEKDFKIDWFTISMQSLDGRHSYNECEGMWNGYLNLAYNHKEWTEEEEDHLLDVVLKYKAENWEEIAKEMSNRSPYQCFVHYRAILSNKTDDKASKWTKEEDDLLIRLKDEMQIGSMVPWTKIASKMPGRSKLQIYHRFTFTLDPEINRSRFTIEEDCILMAAVKEYGQNFQNFPANLLPGRTSVQIRNRYNNVLKHVGQRDHWSLDYDTRLMELVQKYGESDWVKVSKELGSHNRTSCRSRYNTIKRFLEKNPNSTIENVPRRKRAFSTNVTANNWMETIIREKHRDLGIIAEVEPETPSERRTFAGIEKTPLGAKYFDYFRTSYNFNYGEKHVASSDFMQKLSTVNKILDSSHAEKRFKNSLQSDYTDLSNAKNDVPPDDSGVDTNTLLPVNYNTLVGLRGLTILCENEKNASEKDKTEVVNHPSLDLFKRRFMAALKNTALIAKAEGQVEKDVRVKLQREPVLPKRFQSETATQNTLNTSGINETIFIVSDVTDVFNSNDTISTEPLRNPEPEQRCSFGYELSNRNGNYQMVIYDKAKECEAGPSGLKRQISKKNEKNCKRRKNTE